MKTSKLFLSISIIITFITFGSNITVFADDTAAPIQNGIVVYYFHGNQRCQTCLNIEELSRTATTQYLKDRINNTPIKFISVNVEEEANEHFIQDYQLLVRSVVIANIKYSKEIGWRRLDKVWKFHSDPEKFFNYFNTEIKLLLTGNTK